MVELRIEQGFGRLGLKISPFNHDLKIRNPEVEIKQTPADIFIKQPSADFEIDYRPALDSLGYYGLYSGLQNQVQEASAVALAGIERRVMEGNYLANIHQEIDIPQIADEATKPQEKDLQIRAIAPIKIHFNLNSVQWDANLGGVEVNLNRGSVEGKFKYGTVKAYLEQEPFIRFKTVGQVFDTKR